MLESLSNVRKDLDSSLVSNKNLSQKIKSSGWCPAPGNMSRYGLKPTPLMSPTLETKSKTFQFFFIAIKKTCHIFWLLWVFEQLWRTIASWAMELENG